VAISVARVRSRRCVPFVAVGTVVCLSLVGPGRADDKEHIAEREAFAAIQKIANSGEAVGRTARLLDGAGRALRHHFPAHRVLRRDPILKAQRLCTVAGWYHRAGRFGDALAVANMGLKVLGTHTAKHGRTPETDRIRCDLGDVVREANLAHQQQLRQRARARVDRVYTETSTILQSDGDDLWGADILAAVADDDATYQERVRTAAEELSVALSEDEVAWLAAALRGADRPSGLLDRREQQREDEAEATAAIIAGARPARKMTVDDVIEYLVDRAGPLVPSCGAYTDRLEVGRDVAQACDQGLSAALAGLGLKVLVRSTTDWAFVALGHDEAKVQDRLSRTVDTCAVPGEPVPGVLLIPVDLSNSDASALETAWSALDLGGIDAYYYDEHAAGTLREVGAPQ